MPTASIILQLLGGAAPVIGPRFSSVNFLDPTTVALTVAGTGQKLTITDATPIVLTIAGTNKTLTLSAAEVSLYLTGKTR